MVGPIQKMKAKMVVDSLGKESDADRAWFFRHMGMFYCMRCGRIREDTRIHPACLRCGFILPESFIIGK